MVNSVNILSGKVSKLQLYKLHHGKDVNLGFAKPDVCHLFPEPLGEGYK